MPLKSCVDIGGSVVDAELGMFITGVVAGSDRFAFAMSITSCCRTGERLFCGSGDFVGVGVIVKSVLGKVMSGPHALRLVGRNL